MRASLVRTLAWALPAVATSAQNTPPSPAPRGRTFAFTYSAAVKDLPPGAAAVDVWVPLPPTDEEQTVTDLKVEGPADSAVTEEKEFGNRMAYFHLNAPKAPLDFRISFRAVRKEVVLRPAAGPEPELTPADRGRLARFLQPERLCVINDDIRAMAKEITTERRGVGERGRAIYDYVQAHMRYDKAGAGWGNGDTVFACTEKRGNCTDFHALFISLARASEIPAVFEMGFPLPADRAEGAVGGYHCWMRFYQPARGWIPVDASEGWKQKDKTEYFFGALDENRIRFTRGRDVVLEPPQKGPPLNYFIYPYVEVDGKPHAAVDRSFSFRDLP